LSNRREEEEEEKEVSCKTPNIENELKPQLNTSYRHGRCN
jgi:hypothetical protein